MKERKIALLIDVDNVKISGAAFKELHAALRERGEIVYSKFYGYNDRKHVYLSDLISKFGYETAPFMRFKKRFSQLDNRMFVDAVRLNYTKPEINTYCIVAGDGDLIPLLVELKSSGKELFDINTEYQEINGHMFDEHIILPSITKAAEVYTSKISKIADKVKEKPAKKATTTTKKEVKEEDAPFEIDYNLSQILRGITARYNTLDFTEEGNMDEKLRLISDIEQLIFNENKKGEGVYSRNPDIKQIFADLQEVVEDMKNALN